MHGVCLLPYILKSANHRYHTESREAFVLKVVVAEGAPKYGGHLMARKLAQAGINTTAIADSAIFAMMARVNKVTVHGHKLAACICMFSFL